MEEEQGRVWKPLPPGVLREQEACGSRVVHTFLRLLFLFLHLFLLLLLLLLLLLPLLLLPLFLLPLLLLLPLDFEGWVRNYENGSAGLPEANEENRGASHGQRITASSFLSLLKTSFRHNSHSFYRVPLSYLSPLTPTFPLIKISRNFI